MKNILMCIGLMLGLLFCGCDVNQCKHTQSQNGKVVYSMGVMLKTVSYDGHDFIVACVDRGGSIVHHPDCKCKSNVK